MANADSPSNMLWLINQATAGEISGQSAPPPGSAKKEAPAAAGGASFGNFKIDMNA
jgi:hypothetical protein